MAQHPHTSRERSSWALISILFIIALFAGFWYWQNGLLDKNSSGVPTSTPTALNLEPVAQSDADQTSPDFTALEASAVNIPIPDFSEAL